ncbi:MAG: hypothetical protein LBG60_01200 [Bifidobacteriaceae bacterium]|nr:hypothetical protein [Bifidobacteriaceae bacterium]
MAKARSARGLLTMGTLVRIAVTAAFLIFLAPTSSIWFVSGLMFVAGIYNSQNLGSSIGMAVYTMAIAMSGFAGGFRIALIVALCLAGVCLVLAQVLRPLHDADAPAPEPAQAQ